MTNGVAVEPVALALVHGVWFLPALEAVVRPASPAVRCVARELGWMGYAVFALTSPLHPQVFGLGVWVSSSILLLGLVPGAWSLLRWVYAVHLLQKTTARAQSWREYRGVPVRLGDVPVALTWGIQPSILLPRAARCWPESRLQAVLAHEHAHVVRRDFLRRLAGTIVSLVLGAHPSFSWSWRRHLLDVEKAADERAVSSGVPRRSYAQALLDLGRVGPASPVAALSSQSRIAERIEAVMRQRRAAPAPVIVGLTVVLCAVLAACTLRAPVVEAPPPPPGCDVPVLEYP